MPLSNILPSLLHLFWFAYYFFVFNPFGIYTNSMACKITFTSKIKLIKLSKLLIKDPKLRRVSRSQKCSLPLHFSLWIENSLSKMTVPLLEVQSLYAPCHQLQSKLWVSNYMRMREWNIVFYEGGFRGVLWQWLVVWWWALTLRCRTVLLCCHCPLERASLGPGKTALVSSLAPPCLLPPPETDSERNSEESKEGNWLILAAHEPKYDTRNRKTCAY